MLTLLLFRLFRQFLFLQHFQKFVQSPVLKLYLEISISFFCSITIKNVQIFHKNSWLKPMFTSNRRLLPSNTRSVST